MRTLIIALSLLMIILIGCETNSTGIESEKMGTLTIYLTDAAADYDSVNITFSEVSAHIDSEWVVVQGEPVTVDLLEWSNGKSMVLGSADVPAGKYTQIRIKIDDAEIGVNEQVYPLDVPSGAQTGLKLGPQFTINAGSSYELIVDFDACRSIVTTGPKNDPKGYKLKPRLRVMAMAITGSIFGNVSNPDSLPIAYAIQENDTITSSFVNPDDGYFKLSFLPEGLYKVSIVDTSENSYNQDDVRVNVGVSNNIGTIILE
jgi:hypothetical protein